MTIDELDRLEAAATPKPWHVPAANIHRIIAFHDDGRPRTLIVEHPEQDASFGADDVSYHQQGSNRGGSQCAADRALIAALRNHAKWLTGIAREYAAEMQKAAALAERLRKHDDARVFRDKAAAILAGPPEPAP